MSNCILTIGDTGLGTFSTANTQKYNISNQSVLPLACSCQTGLKVFDIMNAAKLTQFDIIIWL